MEDFNYDNKKYLNLKKINTEKVKEIYRDYEEINFSIENDKILMNGFKVAKIDKNDKDKAKNDIQGSIDFDTENILSVSYL
ncbi:hypothetical protein [Staphylococcus shinii]|uniref:hypothetical protein n=1 Tax=Staphylococcus shinii TaxID=2912228 RepID=UPI003F54E679